MPDIEEDILRQLMLRSTDDLFAPPAAASAAIRRQRRHRMRTRVIGVAGTAAVAGIAIGTVASTSGSELRLAPAGQGTPDSTSTATPYRLTAAQQTLSGLSAAAAKMPRPSGRYVVLAEKTFVIDTASGPKTNEIGPETSVINTVTGSDVMYQDITVSGSGSAGTPAPPAVQTFGPDSLSTNAQLDAMPTDPTALRAFLLAQAKQQLARSNQMFAEQAKKAGKKIKIGTTSPQPTDDDLVFEQATDLLWEPNLSSALRSAAYKVLETTPGVIVKTGVADSSGRPAVKISRRDTDGYADVETFEDPATGATLETLSLGSGQTDKDLYQSITYTNTIPANPYQG